MQAAICTIGDEILIGQIVDTNSSHIAKMLNSIGIRVAHMCSVSDGKTDIKDSLDRLLREYDIVIVTGGLGPTKDDITKMALAELYGSHGYYHHQQQWEIVKTILTSRGIELFDTYYA
ncbi:MAG: damage-inducible protein CinA, partial [Alistipes sp.]|nr:damage-inducible protein CinA [Candidatus Minthomonas equi]